MVVVSDSDTKRKRKINLPLRERGDHAEKKEGKAVFHVRDVVEDGLRRLRVVLYGQEKKANETGERRGLTSLSGSTGSRKEGHLESLPNCLRRGRKGGGWGSASRWWPPCQKKEKRGGQIVELKRKTPEPFAQSNLTLG